MRTDLENKSQDKRFRKLEKLIEPELPEHYFPSFSAKTLNFIARISLLSISYYYFGFFLFLFAYFLVIFSFKYLIKAVFKLELVRNNDKFFINHNNLYSRNSCSIYNIDNFDKEELNLKIRQNLFDRIPKLQASLVSFLGDFYWNTPQVAHFSQSKKEEIINSRIINVTIKDESELISYIEEQTNIMSNPFVRPLEYHIIEYENQSNNLNNTSNTNGSNSDNDNSYFNNNNNTVKGAILSKINHSFSDGLGIVSLIGFVDDHYDIHKYPRILRRNTNMFVYYLHFIFVDLVKGFIFFIISIFKKDPIYNKKKYAPYENKPSKINSGMTLATNPIVFSTQIIKAISKAYKASINDIYLYIILKALKQISPESEIIKPLIPVGIAKLPKSSLDVELWNKFSAIIDYIYLPDDKRDFSINKFKCIDTVKSLYKARVLETKKFFMAEFLHFDLLKYFQMKSSPDMTISNIPAQEKPITIGKGVVTNIFGVPSCGNLNVICNVISYCDNFSINITVDKNIGIEPAKLLKIVDGVYEDIIKDIDFSSIVNTSASDKDVYSSFNSFNSKKTE